MHQASGAKVPFLVTHYTPEIARRKYIEREWESCPDRERFRIEFITSHDREQPSIKTAYVYDEKLYREMIQTIKDIQIGYWIAHKNSNASFRECVEWWKTKNTSLDQDFRTFPWLRDIPSPGDVSLILKHREAWNRLAESDAVYGVIAEDDIIFNDRSLIDLQQLIRELPHGAEYIDIAGGAGFFPRADNKLVNKRFYEIDPPKTRTTCAAILTRSFARKLIDLNAPICLGIDWTLNWAFAQLRTKVYWVEPTVFGHGSMMRIYESLREAERRE
jgi:hypothetical protein